MLKVMDNPVTLKPLKPIGKILQNIGNINIRRNSIPNLDKIRKLEVQKQNDKNDNEAPLAVICAILIEVLSHIQLGKTQFDSLVTNLLEHCRAVPQVSFKYVAPSYTGKFSSIQNNMFTVDMRHFIKSKQNSLLSSQVSQSGYRFNITPSNEVKKIILQVTNFQIQINGVKYFPFMDSDLIHMTQESFTIPNGGQIQLLTNQKIYNSSIEPLYKLLLQVLKQNVTKCFIEFQGDIQIYQLIKQLFDYTDYFIQLKYFIQEVNSKEFLNSQANVLYISLQNDKIIVGDQYIELDYSCVSIINCLINNYNVLFPQQDSENNNILQLYLKFYNNFIKEIKNLQHDIQVFTIQKNKIIVKYDDNLDNNRQNMDERYYEQQQLIDDIFQDAKFDFIEDDDMVNVIFDTKHYVQSYITAISQLTSLKSYFVNKDVIVTGEMLQFPLLKNKINEVMKPFAGISKTIKFTK